MTIEHGPDSGRIHRLAKRAADARERAEAAAAYGDDAGARFARAEAARLRKIIAEG